MSLRQRGYARDGSVGSRSGFRTGAENSFVASPLERYPMRFLAEQSHKRFAAPYTLLVACALLALHSVDLLVWGTRGPGPILSDLLQEAMAVLCVVAAYKASRVSENFGRFFWGLCVVSFSLFAVAQGLASYDSSFGAPHFIEWAVNVLFFFWLTPMAMALFLEVDFALKGFDWLLLLDVVQVMLFWFTGYFYFYYIPEQAAAGMELARSVWAPYFIFVGFVIAAFILRAILSESPCTRSLFIRVAAFLLFAGVADFFFYYGPGKDLPNGSWFDFLWISNTFLFVVLAATWQAAPGAAPVILRRSLLVQALPLLYSLLIVVICARIVQQRLSLAASVVLTSFACSGARLLVTQYRQQRVQQLLQAVIEGTNDAIFVKDREGRYLMVNSAAAARIGQQVSSLLGKTNRDVLAPDSALEILEREQAALQQGENQTFEEQLPSEAGSLTCLTTLGPFRNA